jgi:signal transduction histidine kinase
MPWTGEDTKDVFKKVIGGLLAAAILAMVYAIVEKAEWYYAATVAIVLVVLVIVLVVRLMRPARPEGEMLTAAKDGSVGVSSDTPSPGEVRHASEIGESPAGVSAPRDDSSRDEKVLKKAFKAEEKRRKKEAKAREK